MLVSVIMPAYNVERYLDQAIRSLLLDLGPVQLDIIVIDDGSTDGSVAAAREAMQRHAEVRLIEVPHGGISAARNRGLDAIPQQAEFVTFHDADDVAFPGRIARQAARLAADPEAQVVYGQLQFFDLLDDERLLPAATARTMTMHTVQLSCGLYRRQVFERIGRFDESLAQAEDTDFLFRLVEAGTHVLMEEEVATFYRRHDTNTTRDVLGARNAFMQAIHKSLKRRRSSGGKGTSALSSGIFGERAKFEELFEKCQTAIPS